MRPVCCSTIPRTRAVSARAGFRRSARRPRASGSAGTLRLRSAGWLPVPPLAGCRCDVAARRVEELIRLAEISVLKDPLKAADDLATDLIVVSTPGRGRVARMRLGSVTPSGPRSSPVKVLVISPGDAV